MYLFGQQAGAQAPQGSMLGMLIPFVLIFVLFYFMIIMPARKKQKQHQNLINSLKGGERVITAGGIYGTVSRVMDDRIEVQVDTNTKLQITKSSISAVIEPTAGKTKE